MELRRVGGGSLEPPSFDVFSRCCWSTGGFVDAIFGLEDELVLIIETVVLVVVSGKESSSASEQRDCCS